MRLGRLFGIHIHYLLIFLIASSFSTSVLAEFDVRVGALGSYGFNEGFGWGYGVEAEIVHSSGLSFGIRRLDYRDGQYHFRQNSRFARIDRYLPVETVQAGFMIGYIYPIGSFEISGAISYLNIEEEFTTYALLPNDGTDRITASRSDWSIVPSVRAFYSFDRVSIRLEVFYVDLDEYVTGLPASPDNLVHAKRSTVGLNVGVSYRF